MPNSNNQNKHYLLVGLPYAGKTTLATALVNNLNFVHINIDQLKWDRGYTAVGDDDVPDRVWDDIFQEADTLLAKHLRDGKNVVNEYAWITKNWRDRARKVAKNCGCETIIVYIKVPIETIMKRWKTNESTRARFQWPEKEMEDILRDFEEPTIDEKVIIYDQSISPEIWVRENITTY